MSDNKPSEKLLGEFEKPSYEQWREAAEMSLKGAPFEKKLLTQTYEGLTLSPIYNAQDVPELAGVAYPGETPFVRGARIGSRASDDWVVAQEMTYPSVELLAEALRNDVQRGLTAVCLVFDRASRSGWDPDTADVADVGREGTSVSTLEDFEKILSAMGDRQLPVFMSSGTSALAATSLLAAAWRRSGRDFAALTGAAGCDPLRELAASGELPRPLDELYREMAAVVRWGRENAPRFYVTTVDASIYHDAGASAVEEVACAVATAVEYVDALAQRGIKPEEGAGRVRFEMAVGGDFFGEIAKFRALRAVWGQALAAFGASEQTREMWLHARGSAGNKSALDCYVNMLRGTTETFAAAVGGADSIHTAHFDGVLGLPDTFSRRVARNVQVILAEESRLGHVIDPAGGAWFVESLTGGIAEKAWDLFRQIEKAGGMAAALASGMIQERLEKLVAKRRKDIETRKKVFVGANMYANHDEKTRPVLDVDLEKLAAERRRDVAQQKKGAAEALRETLARLKDADVDDLTDAAVTACERGASLGQICETLSTAKDAQKARPLSLYRPTEIYEGLRARADAFAASKGRRPKVFLANVGPAAQHKPRADFSRVFFEAGGFDVMTNNGFDTAEEAARQAVASRSEVVTICSTDDAYPQIVPVICDEVRKAGKEMIIVLAGYPKEQLDAHKKSGVDEFIHIKANNYETLSGLLEKMGA